MAPTINADDFTNPISVNTGGTGKSSLIAYAPIVGGTTSTSPLQQATTGLATAGYTLTSQGAGNLPIWTANPALVLLETLTSASAASFTFTSTFITSAYTTYMVTFNNIKPSSGATMEILFSTNNGSSYLSTGYQSTQLQTSYTSGTTSVTSSTADGIISAGAAGGDAINGFIFINLPQSGQASYVGKTVSVIGSLFQHNVGGSNSGTAFVNNIQFIMSAGNISGTISLYGIKQ